MGLFGNTEEKAAKKQSSKRASYMRAGAEVYDKLRYHLAQKDGKTHVVMVNSFSKWLNQTFECEEKYSGQIDSIISLMQDDGYEIVDVKFNSIQGQGLTGQMEGFHTLIIYK